MCSKSEFYVWFVFGGIELDNKEDILMNVCFRVIKV